MKKMMFLVSLSLLVGCTNKVETPIIEEKEKNCLELEFLDVDQESLSYELVFSDEFDGTELDMQKWGYATGGDGFGNNELQYYTLGENLTINDGLLTIEGRYEEYRNSEYTSSKIWTMDRFEFTYGKVEVRAKLPEGLGTWPAVWMMPANSEYGGWPQSGEIDIMEHVGYDPGNIHGTIHTKAYNHMKGTQKGGTLTLDDPYADFHTYEMEWLPDRIHWYLDGELYYSFQPTKYIDCLNYTYYPFTKDFYLIINLAIGGDWGGAKGVNSEDYPTDFVIDYIKVYQASEYK